MSLHMRPELAAHFFCSGSHSLRVGSGLLHVNNQAWRAEVIDGAANFRGLLLVFCEERALGPSDFLRRGLHVQQQLVKSCDLLLLVGEVVSEH